MSCLLIDLLISFDISQSIYAQIWEIRFGKQFLQNQLTDDSALSAQSSLKVSLLKSIFENAKYFILQNKYLRIHEDSFGAKIPRDDYTLICPSIQQCITILMMKNTTNTCNTSYNEKILEYFRRIFYIVCINFKFF